jgi:hypothetical protein
MRRASLLLSALLFVSLTPSLQASVARAVDFDEKVTSADAIIVGRCVRSHSAFDSTGRWIVTYSTFQVSKSLKGFTAGEITIATPGGQVGSLHQETIGVPKFGVGDSNVLFVRTNQEGSTVLNFDQGAYRISDDGQIVRPVESHLVLIDSQTGRAKSLADEPARTLEQFESEVRGALSAKGRINR